MMTWLIAGHQLNTIQAYLTVKTMYTTIYISFGEQFFFSATNSNYQFNLFSKAQVLSLFGYFVFLVGFVVFFFFVCENADFFSAFRNGLFQFFSLPLLSFNLVAQLC